MEVAGPSASLWGLRQRPPLAGGEAHGPYFQQMVRLQSTLLSLLGSHSPPMATGPSLPPLTRVGPGLFCHLDPVPSMLWTAGWALQEGPCRLSGWGQVVGMGEAARVRVPRSLGQQQRTWLKGRGRPQEVTGHPLLPPSLPGVNAPVSPLGGE